MHLYIVKDIICLIQGRDLFDFKKFLYDSTILCLNLTNLSQFK